MIKILIADRIAPIGVKFLKGNPHFEVIEAYGASPQERLEQVKDVHAIVVRSETQITAELMIAAPALKVIGRAGVGVDNVDLEAATERGIIVMNTPEGNTIATAELTFTHILCAARPVPQALVSMKNGKWDRKSFSGNELLRKKLGILGFGRIGREVSKRAQAFGMEVMAYDPFLTEAFAKSLGVKIGQLEELFRFSDYITVHMPLTDKTKHIIDEAAFEKMKPGVRIFNCARGGIIKESALIDALKTGKVAAAGLDVYEEEPLSQDSPLLTFPNVVLTPHLGASTQEAQESVGLEIAQSITQVLENNVVNNAVNMPSVDKKTLELLSPYLHLGEKLGAILQQISPNQVERIQISYSGKIADLDAMPVTRAIQSGYLRRIYGSDVNDVNAPKKMKQLGIDLETVVKSTHASSFTELIEIESFSKLGIHNKIAGTLFSRDNIPRIVFLNGHRIEVGFSNHLLILKNNDVPGMIGFVGSIIGKDGVNIANMSLSRDNKTNVALTVFELDSPVSQSAIESLRSHHDIASVQVILC